MKKCIKAISALTAVAVTILFGLTVYLNVTLPNKFYVVEGEQVVLHSKLALSVKNDKPSIKGRATAVSGVAGSSHSGKLMLFGIIPIKTATVDVVKEKTLVPCGTPFGIKMFTDGVLVVGVNDIDTENGAVTPAKEAGIKLGDSILTINGKTMLTNEDVSEIVAGSNGKALTVVLRRKSKDITVSLEPVKSQSDGKYKAGLWVRDSSAGIGTVTFYDPSNGSFGGLGHAVCDVDTGDILPLMSGEVAEVSINGVVKGRVGTPGELKGSFVSQHAIGSLLINNETGVFGLMDYCPSTATALPLAMKQEVKAGKATILTTLDGKTPQEYEIKIERLSIGSTNLTKNMVIRVTDKKLLSKTGGIVQGMSGSPIIQDGKLVGAVTHVLVNDPTCGYGIFAENMYHFSETLEQPRLGSAA